MTTDKEAGEPYGVRGFPTLKYFGFNKEAKPEDYKGGRDADSIVTYGLEKLTVDVRAR
jgi:protein disulfide-isomerase A6